MAELALTESEVKNYDIPMDDIYCDDGFNCRGPIVPMDVDDLTRSIEANGLEQAIVIQPWTGRSGKKWRIVSGHRRFTAFLVLRKNDPAKYSSIRATIKEGLTELQAKKLNLEENLKRKDLNILQEAKALQVYVNATWNAREIAEDLGQPEPWVRTRLSLLKLPELIQAEAEAGFLTQEHIKQLAMMKQTQQQYDAVKRIKESKLAGEKKKIEIKPKKPNDPLKKRKRERHEMFTLINQMKEVIGFGLHTRVLAWAAGEISDLEIHRDIKEAAQKAGKNYVIPAEVQAALTT